MRLSGAGGFRNSTPLAVLVGILAVVPGLLAGGIVVVAYTFLTAVGSRTGGTTWIPALDGLLALAWDVVVPETLRGFVAMFAALWATFQLFKGVNHEAVIYSATAVWCLLYLGILLITGFSSGFFPSHVGLFLNGVGFLCAAFYARVSLLNTHL